MSAEQLSDKPAGSPVHREWLESMLLVSAIAIGAGLTAVYRAQQDALAAVTVIPAWCWLLPALGVLLVTRSRCRSLLWIGLCLTLVVYTGLCVEQSRSLFRGPLSLARPDSPQRSWRIISLNCHVGTPGVAEELATLSPDVVLLQESPPDWVLEEMARMLFGSEGTSVSMGDCSIVARGELSAVQTPRDARFVQAVWTPVTGTDVTVCSLRLTPPSTRLDWWRPSCWETHRRRRESQRAQIEELAAELAMVPPGSPLIVGGDFNSPAGDAAQDPLRACVKDSFNQAGRGWGCTFSRGFPFHRIDQVWLSDAFKPLQTGALPVEHSDHRAVVCDAVLSAKR